MHVVPSIAVLLVLYFCDVCLSIRVPVNWDGGTSEVQPDSTEHIQNVPPVETYKPLSNNYQIQQPIPVEYFQYTAKKPQFAVDIASFHGVQNPQDHYTAYPVKPYTGRLKPDLGKHRIFDQKRPLYEEFQKYVTDDENPKQVSSVSSNYEVFHPYKDEEPALQELYKDPILDKIRNDIRDNKNRLQNYENEAGKKKISKDEYLESLDQTDNKKRPQKNYPATYEIHRPLRRPVYYQKPQHFYQRDNYLNRKFKNPWNHHYKVRPINYNPIKHHLQSLRQHHALKYDDEHNEYPQLPPKENFAEPPDGYDIYEKGQEKYKQLRDQLDESINESVKKNRPTNYNKLEMQNDGTKEAYTAEDEEEDEDEDEEDFVPIKNYAQVRKTETFKHLPQKAAFDDADNLDEIKNAPRLKEAVKSTKAQTVYTEEGYEDTAYDHAGEQKHAGDHEAHEGFLREKELSGGNYKTPSVTADHEDGSATVYRDQLKDGKQWKDSKKEKENENHQEDYAETGQEDSTDVDAEDHLVPEESNIEQSSEIIDEKSDTEHGVTKREVNLIVPEINLNDTLLTEQEITELAQINIKNMTQDELMHKYPYYFKKSKNINKDSPLRYAEDMKLIPKKRKGNTAFYDSKSKFQCPDIDIQVDPVPEHLKNGERPDSEINDESSKTEDVSENEPRLKGLGDKIDCFKAKYFGKDPLDSPFFNEPLIENPEPITVPNIDIFRLSPLSGQSKGEYTKKLRDSLQKKNNDDLFLLLEKLDKPLFNRSFDLLYNQSSNNSTREIKTHPTINITNVENENNGNKNRKKRDTTFVYEPYKIIRDSKKNESRKLQKHLKLDEHINSPNNYFYEKDQPVKRNVGIRSYINIGKNERTNSSKGDDTSKEITFVNVDKRRGEPKYEVKVHNHKSKYSPVHDQKAMSIEDYRKKITNAPKDSNGNTARNQMSSHLTQVTIPTAETHKTSASNSVQRVIAPASSKSNTKSTTPQTQKDKDTSKNKNTSIEEYDEYDSEEEEDDEVTTTTTLKPQFRKKTRATTTTTTTTAPVDYEEIEEKPKLKLVTRFRNTNQKEINDDKGEERNKNELIKSRIKNLDEPKYIEKKKKSSKSTLVTDTNTYADNDDDMRKEEVDSLIGVQHNMDDYMPLYEKEMEKSPGKSQAENYDEDENDSSSEEEDDESTEENDSEEEEEEEEITAPQQSKKTSLETVEVPEFTNKNRSNRITDQPIVVRKRIEIHKEIPANKSSPHVTQFKQDLKEIEITKEIPIRRKLKKNTEAFELYKDPNLAKDINKLKSVEVFKENLDLSTGPKHGGNYRSARITLPSNSTHSRKRKPITAPQSRNAKLIELDDDDDSFKTHEIDIDSSQESYKNKDSHNRRTEDSEVRRPQLHGGNLKKDNLLKPRQENKRLRKPAKLIELSEEHEDYNKNEMEERNSKSSDSESLHGGNYRSAKLTQLVRDDSPPKDAKANAAALLNSFAQAVPILTTTPAYILDPSKRMYYYVDT